jgi:hypothetical protein
MEKNKKINKSAFNFFQIVVFFLLFSFFLFSPRGLVLAGAADELSSCELTLEGKCVTDCTEECLNGVCVLGYCDNENLKCCVPRGLQGSINLFKGSALYGGFFGGVTEPELFLASVIQGALLLIGTIFGILVIYGGYLWMVARGNEEYVKKAKNILEAAAIGIVIVMGAYAISSYIIDVVTRASEIPSGPKGPQDQPRLPGDMIGV